MFGFIRKSDIQRCIKRAERRASLKTAKEYRLLLRQKDAKIRRLEKYVGEVQEGYALYKEAQERYLDGADKMRDKLYRFRNEINQAIGLLSGGFDAIEYQVLADKISDRRVVKLIS